MDDVSYTIVEDLPESRYTALAIGAGLLEGAPDYSQSMSYLFSFRVHKHGSRDIYGSPMISPVAIYDLDMPYCNPSGTVVWNSPFAEIAQPVYGFGDYPSNRIFIVNNSSISVYDTSTPSMPGPLTRDITCSNLGKDVITHTLQTGFIMEGNFGSQPGLGINSFGTLGAQKVIDFNLVFPIVSVLAGEGGNVSATQQVVERNFGDPYVLQVTPDNGYNIKNIAIESLDTSSVINNFTLEDFLADSATVPGSVVTLDNGIQFKYKGDGVVNVILPAQYLLGTNDVTQPDYDDFEIVVTFEDENGNSDDPVVPNTGGDDIENPNTADVIYLPVITLGAAIAVLAYRKRRQI